MIKGDAPINASPFNNYDKGSFISGVNGFFRVALYNLRVG